MAGHSVLGNPRTGGNHPGVDRRWKFTLNLHILSYFIYPKLIMYVHVYMIYMSIFPSVNFHIDEKRDAYTYVFMDAHAIYATHTRIYIYTYAYRYKMINVFTGVSAKIKSDHNGIVSHISKRPNSTWKLFIAIRGRFEAAQWTMKTWELVI